MGAVGSKPNQGLDLILELFGDGKVVPIVDSTYPLSETAEAFRYFATGHVQGKTVITIRGATPSTSVRLRSSGPDT